MSPISTKKIKIDKRELQRQVDAAIQGDPIRSLIELIT